MDWLKDKKNLPIIAGIAGLVIALVVVFFIMQARKSSATGADMYGSSGAPAGDIAMQGGVMPTPPAPVPTATMAGVPGTPVAVNGIKTTPSEASRPDPFKPFYDPKKKQPPPPPLYVPSPGRLFPPRASIEIQKGYERQVQELAPQPQRRMAGLLYNQRLYAILETNGESQVVKPGDITSDGTAKVEIIEPTKIILRTLTADPKDSKIVEVAMANSNRPVEQTQQTQGASPSTPYSPYGPQPTPTRGGNQRGRAPSGEMQEM